MLTQLQQLDSQSIVRLNWQIGWCLLLLAFISGAIIGLGFHRDEYLGGYNSFRRRLVRLGHIAMAALGMLNILFSVAPCRGELFWPSLSFVVGGFSMPAVCFLTAWRPACRHLFFIPVVSLIAGVVLTLYGSR